jgi:hypothetical protein
VACMSSGGMRLCGVTDANAEALSGLQRWSRGYPCLLPTARSVGRERFKRFGEGDNAGFVSGCPRAGPSLSSITEHSFQGIAPR